MADGLMSGLSFAGSAATAMLLADGRLPAGGHAHSAGLEPAIVGGLPLDGVRDYVVARMRSVAMVDAATAVVARHVAVSTGGTTSKLAAALGAVEDAWSARTPSPALRSAARDLGWGLTRVAQSLWPEHPAIIACRRVSDPESALSSGMSRPVVMGAIAAAAELDASAIARLVFYDDAQAVATAMLKLEPLDPLLPQRWVLDACAVAESLLPDLVFLTLPSTIPAAGAPQMEEWAEAHSTSNRKLFRA